MRSDPSGDLHIVLTGGAALGEGSAEEWKQVLLLGRESGEVGTEVEVGDPIGRLCIELHGRPPHVDVAAWNVLELHRDVGELEGGKRFEILLRLLVGFQPQRVLDDLLLVLAGQFRFGRRQPVELSLAVALLELGVGHDRQEGAVLVVEQLGADEVFEKAPFCARLLEMLQVGVKVHRAEGIASIQVGGHRSEEDAQRVRQTGVGAFALLELQVVDRSVDLRGVDTSIGHAVQRLEDDLLHLLRILGGDALQAGAEDRLLVVVMESAAVGERTAQAGVDECFSQWRTRVGEENLAQYFHRQGAERIRAGHRDPCGQGLRLGLVVFAGHRGVRLDGRGWLGETLDVWNG